LTADYTRFAMILKSREFDRFAQDFLKRHPDGVVVHIGCGFDTRFERVDNGQVEWYDLDLPEVIGLRRKMIGSDGERYHLLGCSVLDSAWMDAMKAHLPRPFLFLAEGVFMYFKEAQVKSLVLTLLDHFPEAEMVFDAFSPFHIWRSNLQVTFARLGSRFPRLHWGLWRGQEVERWGDGIRLIDNDSPEPRLGYFRWFRHIPLAARAGRIYHFQLGKTEKK
jgi:O-methyltransferase involved in polyketide biosynthesis